MPEITETIYVKNAAEWRAWLEKNHDKKSEIWLILPKKASGKPKILYNDSVEEALCFGWIDSTAKTYSEEASVQRFTPRKNNKYFSQQNIERLRVLKEDGKLLPEVEKTVQPFLDREFVFPQDIINRLKKNPDAWSFFNSQSDAYKRIRIGYVEELRKNEEEFERRLNNLIKKSAEGKTIGYGGIDKYY